MNRILLVPSSSLLDLVRNLAKMRVTSKIRNQIKEARFPNFFLKNGFSLAFRFSTVETL